MTLGLSWVCLWREGEGDTWPSSFQRSQRLLALGRGQTAVTGQETSGSAGGAGQQPPTPSFPAGTLAEELRGWAGGGVECSLMPKSAHTMVSWS